MGPRLRGNDEFEWIVVDGVQTASRHRRLRPAALLIPNSSGPALAAHAFDLDLGFFGIAAEHAAPTQQREAQHVTAQAPGARQCAAQGLVAYRFYACLLYTSPSPRDS